MFALAVVAVGLLIGTWRFGFLPSLPSLLTILLLNGLAFFLLACVIRLNKRGGFTLQQRQWITMGCLCFLSAIVGFSWAYVQAKNRLSWSVTQTAKKSLTLKGVVVGVPSIVGDLVRFDLRVRAICQKGDCEYPKPNVRVRCHFNQLTTQIHSNDDLVLSASLRGLQHFANPGSFDREKQLFLENIRGTAVVHRVMAKTPRAGFSVDLFREKLAAKIRKLAVTHRFLGVTLALTLGIKTELPSFDKQVFFKTGTSHLMAISGLHVGLIAGVWFFIGKWIARRFPKILLRFTAPTVGAFFAILGATLYALMAGNSLPTQRALIMLAIVMCGWVIQKRFRPWDLFCVALIGVLLYDPFASLRMEFWLSFGAVGALLYTFAFEPKLPLSEFSGQKPTPKPKPKRWVVWLLPQWVAFVGLMPLVVLFFQRVSFISPLANCIAIPWMSLVVVPLSVFGAMVLPLSTRLGQGLLSLADLSMQLLWPILEGMSRLEIFSGMFVGRPTFFVVGLGIVGALWLLAPKKLPNKFMGCLLLLPLFFSVSDKPKMGQVRFYLLDVGQGLSAVIQTANHTVLYDAGPTYGAHYNAGDLVIVPFLREMGIEAFDKVILSHGDNDHTGGLSPILAEIPVKKVLTGEPERVLTQSEGFKKNDLVPVLCQASQHWEFDGVQFDMLAPAGVGATNGKKGKNSNNQSCVLQVRAGKKKILLTGDIDKSVEHQLIQRYGDGLASDILVAPHHGSLTSSSEVFIQKTAPTYVLFATGRNNMWGFPKPAVQKRYRDLGVKRLNTPETGAIEFTLFNNQILGPTCFREKSRRFWHSDSIMGGKA